MRSNPCSEGTETSRLGILRPGASGRLEVPVAYATPCTQEFLLSMIYATGLSHNARKR